MAYVDHKTTETYTAVEFLKAFHVSDFLKKKYHVEFKKKSVQY